MDPKVFYHGSTRRVTPATTMAEAKELAEKMQLPKNIVVLPPTAGDQSGQVSDDEDVPQDLEMGFEPAGELEIEEDVDDTHVVEPASGSPPRKRKTTSNQAKSDNPNWKKKSAYFDKPLYYHGVSYNLIDAHPELIQLSPFQTWQSIFTPEMLAMFTEQTNLYAQRDCNSPNWNVSMQEMAQFLGILLLSGYNCLPEEHSYWSTQEDLGVSIVSNAMSRNRFYAIKKYFHVEDNNNLEQGNKVAKVSSLYKALNSSLIKFGIFHSQLSIDESMVPYYGRHSAKMFIRGKPIRFGYKIWSLCSADGYPYHLQIYRGKEPNCSRDPLGLRVVNQIVDVVLAHSVPSSHQVYFDNFFTSYRLLKELKERGVPATGTFRDCRTAGAANLLESSKSLQKRDRGAFDYCCDGNLYICKWHDNAVVGIAINFFTHEPIHNTRRRVRNEPNDKVPQPHIIHAYNKG